MANGIELVVDVSVNAAVGRLAEQGFGTIMLLGTSPRAGADLVRYYTRLASVAADYPPGTPEYRVAQRVFEQTPRPARVAIAKRTRLPTQRFTFTPTAALAATRYAWEVDGVVVEFTTDASPTLAEITAGLAAAWTTAAAELGEDAPGVTVADFGGTAVRQTSTTPGAWHAVKVLTPKVLGAAQDQADAGVVGDLADIAEFQPDWYGILTLFPSHAEVLAIAGWAQVNHRLFFYSTVDSNMRAAPYDADTPDVTLGGALLSRSYSTTAGFPVGSTADFTEVGFLSLFCAKKPGSFSMHMKTVVGAPALPLTDTERTNLESYNLNPYITIGNLAKLLGGKVAVGEWVDIIRDTHWDVARTGERLFNLMGSVDKVPMTDEGVSLLTAEVGGQQQVAEEAGFLKAGWKVSAPLVASLSEADRAARRFPNITVEAQYQGAIHFAGVVMNLSV